MFGFGMEYEGLAFWLPVIWAGLIAVAVAMYVIADGFDLGVGILFKAAGSDNWRDRMMFSVAPIWDGNETWLILGGGGLFAVFHIAYAVLMPALYLPIILMLVALIFRGVAFEFRFKADRSKFLWDNAFFFGSLVATFFQGMVLGTFVQGFATDGRQFTGGTFDFLTPFSVLTGISLIFGYGLLGATWCVMKTTGELEIWARRMAVRFLLATIVAMAIVSVWVPFLERQIETRWFSWPNIAFGGGAALPTFFPGNCPVPARLSRPGHQPLSIHRTSQPHDLGYGEYRQFPALRAGGLRDRAADDLRLHGLFLLRLPRQGG
jgi:cytochrome bd ubiquinol oxidase subunit II